jgi:type VI secretion system lysozyme-like protein
VPEAEAAEELVDSVVKHLALILNTHQGSSASAPDFGMPDYLSLSSRTDLDGLRELARILNEVIRKYEPRLRNAAVGQAAGGMESGVVEFSLSGTVEISREKRSLFFSTALNPDGRVVVSK